ncbi:MAG: DNA alkylation repair protein, partial [Muribaculaceae bacterium]|nr:DNA alkylation repair protein [Muribaculaceae bacterium]
MDRGVRAVLEMILAERDDSQREHLMRFFKTGEGEYGEGDRFLGLRVPTTRGIVRKVYGSITFDEIPELLASEWHEVRLCGLLLMVEMMKRNLPGKRDSESVMADKKSRRKAIA